MNRLGNQFLAGTGFAFDEHTPVSRSDFLDQVKYLLHGGTPAKQLLKPVWLRNPSLQFPNSPAHLELTFGTFDCNQNLFHFEGLNDVVIGPFVYEADGVIDIAKGAGVEKTGIIPEYFEED